MPRRNRPPKRRVPPDIKYNSVLVQQFVNKLMIEGRKSTAQRVFYDALDIIEDFHLNYPHIRIIVIGKALSAELAQDAVRYGADGYLIKPIERETLISLI